jgi:hypothetical protein
MSSLTDIQPDNTEDFALVGAPEFALERAPEFALERAPEITLERAPEITLEENQEFAHKKKRPRLTVQLQPTPIIDVHASDSEDDVQDVLNDEVQLVNERRPFNLGEPVSDEVYNQKFKGQDQDVVYDFTLYPGPQRLSGANGERIAYVVV